MWPLKCCTLLSIIIITNLLNIVNTSPHIFDDFNDFCEYNFGNKKLTFPNKFWSVNFKNLSIYFSLCKNARDNSKCRNKTSSCIINNETNEFIDTGNLFQSTESDSFTLQSNGGTKCSLTKYNNYKIVLKFECSDFAKTEPQLKKIDENECYFEIIMRSPDCAPKCTGIVDGKYLIDLRNFTDNVEIKSHGKMFNLGLCGQNRRCETEDVNSCEVSNDKHIPLSSVSSQHVFYDVDKNELTMRGHYLEDGKRKEVHISIKCNWQERLANPKCKNIQNKGKRYNFELESYFGCVKLPQNCVIHDMYNLKYDLSGLFKQETYWRVKGIPQSKMVLNVCGPLRMPKNRCTDEFSQVCSLQNGNYVNRGSILTLLKVDYNDIKAIYSSGSVCPSDKNSTSVYSTEIKFKCSKTESGPVFESENSCTTFLTWETPHVCPIDNYVGTNCQVSDRMSNINLQNLWSETDRSQSLTSSNNVQLVYNFCGPLHTTCNGYSNVSFCLKNKQDKVIGWENTTLISDRGVLRMTLTGQLCWNNLNYGQVNIIFVCSYESPPPAPKLDIILDNCQFNMTVFTSSACISNNVFTSCSYKINETNYYDLSPLSRKNGNYVVMDPSSKDTEYMINVCGPVLSGFDLLCGKDTMLCLKNKTEANVKHRYISLGSVRNPTLYNNSLIIESEMGTYCDGFQYFKSIIYFECSLKEERPRLLTKETCTYKFIWKTNHACPKSQACTVHSVNSDLNVDLSKLTKSLNINISNSTNRYEFNLCSDTYNIRSSEKLLQKPLKRELFDMKESLNLRLLLNENCTTDIDIKEVLLYITCNPEAFNYNYEQKSFENCVLKLHIETSAICSIKKNTYHYTEGNVALPSSKDLVGQPVKLLPCVLSNPTTGYQFNLTSIKPTKVSLKDTYGINLSGNLTGCNGLFCRNDVEVVPYLGSCPVVIYNYTIPAVMLQYYSPVPCDEDYYRIEMWLKCQEQVVASLKDHSSCKLIFEYGFHQACFLLERKLNSGVNVTATIIGGVVVATLIVLLIIIALFYTRKKWIRYLRYKIIHDKSELNLYCRNSSE